MNYKGILLDLDNTLYNYDQAHEIALESAMSLFAEMTALDVQFAYKLYKRAKSSSHIERIGQAASHSRIFYFQRMLEMIGAFDFASVTKLNHNYWDVFYKQMTLEPFVMDFLKEINVPKCIVTDFTAYEQYRKIEKLGIGDWIDFLVTSEEAGVEKPHPYIYMKALDKMQLKPNEVIMIGDSLKKDCLGASQLGIDSIYYKGEREFEDLSKGIHPLKSFFDIIHWLE